MTRRRKADFVYWSSLSRHRHRGSAALAQSLGGARPAHTQEHSGAGSRGRRELWLAERDFLCERLDMRWLVPGCDTFIDHDNDPVLRTTRMNGGLLVNTLGLQEAERTLFPLLFAVVLFAPLRGEHKASASSTPGLAPGD